MKMKLTKEDIQKFGTDDEKKQLLETLIRPTRLTSLRGRKKNTTKFKEYKDYLEVDVSEINTYFRIENWEELEEALDTAIRDLKIMKSFAPKEKPNFNMY